MKATIILSILSSLLLASHFLRSDNIGLFLLSLSLPFLLKIRRKWALTILSLFLFCGAAVWTHTVFSMAVIRLQNAMPWLRMTIIMLSVIIFTFITAVIVLKKRKSGYYSTSIQTEAQSIAAFFLTGIILTAAHLKTGFSILILDRFLPGSAWIQILLLAAYAAWITEKMILTKKTANLRSRIWIIFSVVFFSQLVLGLGGLEIFLMTGKLHIPVPALIIGGPVYRGGGFFMPVLFAASILLAGPAWCSHLCYFGAWDNLASRSRKKPGQLKPWMKLTRVVIFFTVPAAALLLRLLNMPVTWAVIAGIGFGIAGIGIIVFVSRRSGIMTHCTAYCPIGLLADIMGKISPFRIRISDTCTDCGACAGACRDGALSEKDISRRMPGITCTLCGDCTGHCRNKSIGYRFLAVQPETARKIFIVIIVSMHAAFLGLARI